MAGQGSAVPALRGGVPPKSHGSEYRKASAAKAGGFMPLARADKVHRMPNILVAFMVFSFYFVTPTRSRLTGGKAAVAKALRVPTAQHPRPAVDLFVTRAAAGQSKRGLSRKLTG